MNLLYLALGTVVYLYVFWLLYIVVMGLYRLHLRGQLAGVVKVLAVPVVIIGVLVDWIANMTLATVIFLDSPKGIKELVTQRLYRYSVGEDGWRKDWAIAICTHLLDPLDPNGDHC